MNSKLLSQIFSLILLVTLIGTAVPVFANYNASDVLGQPDFTTRVSATTASGLDYPYGLALDTLHHRLFVADCNGKRILVYALDSNNLVSNHFASYVLGQTDFVSSVATSTQTGLSCSYGIKYDSLHDRLFVADGNNNRVLIYDLSAGITNGMSATYVLGQRDFTSHSSNQGGLTASTTLGGPFAIELSSDSTQLFSSDYYNNRVLVFDLSQGIINDMPASYVLGQQNFASSSGNQGGTASSTTLSGPFALEYDSLHKRLFVNDDTNNRVLVFDLSAGITNGMQATYVLGQPDMNTVNKTTTSAREAVSYFGEELEYDSTLDRLFLGDDSRSRILVFDFSAGISTYMSASAVIGAPDFTTSGYPGGGAGTNGCFTTISNICDPELGTSYDSGTNRLWITDNSNNRVLAFDFVKILGYLKDGVAGSAYSDTITSQHAQGTVTYSVYAGSLPAGLTLASTTGVISGTPTSASIGWNLFTIQVTDNNGAIGFFLDRKQFRIGINAAPARHSSGSHSSGGGETVTSYTATSSTTGMPVTIQTIQSSSTPPFTFSTTLRPNTVHSDVRELQKYLNTHGYPVASTGPGSPGRETTKFGRATRNALWLFQTAHNLWTTGTVNKATREVLNGTK